MEDGTFLNELVEFFGDHIFQIPIRTFMDENCLTFDPDGGPAEDHQTIHEAYKMLFNTLLKAFCDDAKVSPEDAISAFDTMCRQNEGLKEYFEVLYDQVMASTNFNVFFGVMAKRNIIIQQQVLVMILAATGSMPASFSLDAGDTKYSGRPLDALVSTADDKQEEELLKQVMKTSEDEHRKLRHLEQQEKEQLRRTMELSKSEAEALSQERKQIEQCLGDLTSHISAVHPPPKDLLIGTYKKLERMTLDPPPVTSVLQPTSSSHRPPKAVARRAPSKTQASASPPPAAPSMKPISSSDAANAWLSSAHEEASRQSSAHAAVVKNLAKFTPGEIEERQKYLMSQRDKLMAMKKAKREDQLTDAVKKNPQRPCSARAAHNAMANTSPAQSADDERQMAMRRAIAEKLKQEVIRK